MDDVLDKFSTTNITDSKTSFDVLYKNWGKLGNQEERRKELLEFQKSKRQSNLDNFRGILDLVNAVEENENINGNPKPRYRPSIYVAGFHKASPSYKNVLMMSEWMVEKPEDFETNWYVMPCPKGVRMLVVANNGKTKFYTKYGHYRFEKTTALPGGNRCEKRWKQNCCVLDCFYVEISNTMLVVDILAWNDQLMTDGETEFRHYWMTTQLNEIPKLQTCCKSNQIKFKVIPKYSCDKESFTKFMMTFPHFENHIPLLDGLLFYHKRVHYYGGETPLVGWLYPYMVPEVLGSDITINQAYMLDKPVNYTNQADFIEKFLKKYPNKYKAPRNSMEMDSQAQNEDGETLEESTMVESKSEVPEIANQDIVTTMEADGSGDTTEHISK